MRATRFDGNGSITLVTHPDAPPAVGEVRVRVGACCLCGSDFRPWKLGWPVTPGHEIAGTVDHPGHGLHGRRVAVYIPVFCGVCDDCRAGHTNTCSAATDLIGWQRPGGYAETLDVPEQCLLPLPDDIPLTLAPLLLDTIGTAAHGVRLARRLVDSGAALVLGTGPLGLGAVLVLRRLGFGPIDVVEPQVRRAAFAAEIGGRVLQPNSIRQRYGLIVEASGKAEARQLALDRVAPRGAIIQLGEAERWDVEETRAIRRKDFYYIRSFYFARDEFAENLDLFRADRDVYARFVDAEAGLQGLPALFDAFARGMLIKPALVMQS